MVRGTPTVHRGSIQAGMGAIGDCQAMLLRQRVGIQYSIVAVRCSKHKAMGAIMGAIGDWQALLLRQGVGIQDCTGAVGRFEHKDMSKATRNTM